MSINVCAKCEGGAVGSEEMFLVTGEVDGVREAQVVYTCFTCGHKWAGEE